MASSSSAVPLSLRPIAHYLNIAKENASRDPVIQYWCLFYAVQTGMTLDKTSKEALQLLTSLLSTLENLKKQLSGQEAISQEIVAQAHIENFVMKLFEYADKNDRQSNFSKGVIRAFYTVGYLIDVLTLFGELDENLVMTRKYARWKAAYICGCLKKGETPVPGPINKRNDDGLDLDVPSFPTANVSDTFGPSVARDVPTDTGPVDTQLHDKPTPPARDLSSLPATVPAGPAVPAVSATSSRSGDNKLTVEDYLEAQKYAKYAVSALSYEDANTAIENMEKALAILKK